MNRNRFAPFREITNIFGVVECLDVFTRTGNSHAIQQFKERRAYEDIKKGRVETAITKVSNIWASLPGAGYGQREVKIQELVEKWREFGGKEITS